MTNRIDEARNIRVDAANLAAERDHPRHISNGDEEKFETAHYAMSFTKGLKHDADTLLVEKREDFKSLRAAIDEGVASDFTAYVPGVMDAGRKWEAPTAGFVYSLQGPDAQAVTMPPAPALGSHELIYEMAEVYEWALLRDVDFSQFDDNKTSTPVLHACARMNALGHPGNDEGERPRK